MKLQDLYVLLCDCDLLCDKIFFLIIENKNNN